MASKNISITQRIFAPTPRFFKKVRAIGLGLAAIGGALLASPVVLPAAMISIAGYLTVAGGMMTAVAQVAVVGE